jgi:hypothetical protein
MSQRIQINPHLSLADLEARYCQCHDPVERSHTQIIWLLAQGRSALAVSAVTSDSRNWIYELARSYNRDGPEALVDYRHQHPGCLTLLDDERKPCCCKCCHVRRPTGGNGMVGRWPIG